MTFRITPTKCQRIVLHDDYNDDKQTNDGRRYVLSIPHGSNQLSSFTSKSASYTNHQYYVHRVTAFSSMSTVPLSFFVDLFSLSGGILAKGQYSVPAMSITIVRPMVEAEADNFLQFFFAVFRLLFSYRHKKNCGLLLKKTPFLYLVTTLTNVRPNHFHRSLLFCSPHSLAIPRHSPQRHQHSHTRCGLEQWQPHGRR